MKKQWIVLIGLMCVLFFKGSAVEIEMQLSRKVVGLNDSFTLIYSAGTSVKAYPDFSPLEQDFSILSSSQGFSTSYVNGAMTQESRWNLVLMPKRTGTLTIPSISFGQDQSPSRIIEVRDEVRSSSSSDSVYLETEVTPQDKLKKGSELLYTIRLFCATQIAQATLTEVTTSDPDAIILRLGQDFEYEHFDPSGKRYKVIERKYAIFPQHEGELTIAPVTFEGQIVTGRGSFFDLQTQYKRLSSDQFKLSVEPIPPPFNPANWFPAKDVKLTEGWSGDPSKMVMGDPITWTIELKADGCLGASIPDLNPFLPDHFKLYIDKPDFSDEISSEGVVGKKQIKIALIPTKEGVFQLPAVEINWWDVTLETEQKAVLPSRELQVMPGAIALNTDQPMIKKMETTEAAIEPTESFFWFWGLLGTNFFLVLVILSLLLPKLKRSQKKTKKEVASKDEIWLACKANDPKACEKALLLWMAKHYPEMKPVNLTSVKALVNDDLQRQVEKLNQALYGYKKDWNGEDFWSALNGYHPPKRTGSKMSTSNKFLRELYPQDQSLQG